VVRVRIMFTKWLLLASSLLVVAFPAYFAYQVIEWLGVGILGLMIACLAMRVELESEGPVVTPGPPVSTPQACRGGTACRYLSGPRYGQISLSMWEAPGLQKG
jgi:hypothetical protein